MKTQLEAINWINGTVGQHLDYDHQYGQQCFDYFNFYYQWLTGDSPYADGFGVSGAKDIWNVSTSAFDKIRDSNTLVPQPGDVLIYGPSWGAGYGHVELCLSSDASGSHLVGENEHNNPSEGVVVVYRTWTQMTGLIGVMRPHFAAPVTYINEAQLTQLYTDLLLRAPDPDAVNHYVGHYTYDFVKQDLLNSVEYGIVHAPKPSPTSAENPPPSPVNSPTPTPVEAPQAAPTAGPVSVPTPDPKPASRPSPEAQVKTNQWSWLINFIRKIIREVIGRK